MTLSVTSWSFLCVDFKHSLRGTKSTPPFMLNSFPQCQTVLFCALGFISSFFKWSSPFYSNDFDLAKTWYFGLLIAFVSSLYHLFINTTSLWILNTWLSLSHSHPLEKSQLWVLSWLDSSEIIAFDMSPWLLCLTTCLSSFSLLTSLSSCHQLLKMFSTSCIRPNTLLDSSNHMLATHSKLSSIHFIINLWGHQLLDIFHLHGL